MRKTWLSFHNVGCATVLIILWVEVIGTCMYTLLYIQRATLVTHHLSRAHIFWRKCWNQTFNMIIYLLRFYLFDDIEKISKSLMRIIVLRQRQFWQKCSCNLNVYIFYLRFALGIIHGDRCDRKTPKRIVLFQVQPPFLVVEASNDVTFWRNARFDVILTSVTITKQVFLRKLFCYESLVDIELSKH